MPASEYYHDNLEPFESALHRIVSAEANLVEFQSVSGGKAIFDRSNIVLRPDPESEQVIAYVRLADHVSKRHRYLVTSFFGDLRHALDDAMCDAAVQLGRANSKGVYFPVSHTASGLERQIKEKCRSVDPALLNFVRSIEPYKHGKNENIWALSKFAGSGKHSRLLAVLPTVTKVWIENSCRFTGYRPNPYPDINNEIAVAIGDPESDLNMAVTYEIVVNAEVTGFSFEGHGSFSNLIGITKSVVLGLKAETERLLRLRG